jgi:hypothetical protein
MGTPERICYHLGIDVNETDCQSSKRLIAKEAKIPAFDFMSLLADWIYSTDSSQFSAVSLRTRNYFTPKR